MGARNGPGGTFGMPAYLSQENFAKWLNDMSLTKETCLAKIEHLESYTQEDWYALTKPDWKDLFGTALGIRAYNRLHSEPSGSACHIKHWAPQTTNVLISHDQLVKRIAELGAELSVEYEGKNPVFVCVLTGAFMFLSELVTHITIPHEVDFVACASYSGSHSTGNVRLDKDMKKDPTNRHVILVEDIVDTGLTLMHLLKLLQARGPASLRSVALLDKPSRRTVDIRADYVGFPIDDVFVVGYGLDYEEKYRSLSYVAVLDAALAK
eukprot:c4808_g1_i1.p1 GENE.c4808_g1_i1~~c4808_g1_i1.p1  ORF type:complete len:266 (-),score=43.44 c4808_g1_i1:29-826(-)